MMQLTQAMMQLMQVATQQVNKFTNALFLRYRLAQALFLSYFVVEFVSLGFVTALTLKFGISPLIAFFSFLGLSMVYTLSFFLAFSYFLYNVVRPRLPKRTF